MDTIKNKLNYPSYFTTKNGGERKEVMAGLNSFQRTLLITDGTVTDLLEQILDESITIEKLYEKIETDLKNIPKTHQLFIFDNKSLILVRKIFLKGESTLNNYLYAESSILINSLPQKFQNDLTCTDIPIGKLWSKYRTETYKSNYVVQREKASRKLAIDFNIAFNSDILSRTYSVYSAGKIIMVITEKFPVDGTYGA